MKGVIIAVFFVSFAFYLNPISGNVNDEGETRGIFSSVFKACFCKCGMPGGNRINRRKPIGRLIGGISAEPNSLPWVAVVILKGSMVATGALLSNRHVITAASPLINATAADTKITLGAHDRCVLDNSQNFSVARITLHPNFDATTKAHDLALVQLSSVVTFDRRISPICLPSPIFRYVDQQITVAGWTTFNSTTCPLRRIRLPLLTETECATSITTPVLLTPDKDCFGLLGSKSVICASDVGAPVQYQTQFGNYELVGIINDGNVCDVVNSTLYVRVIDHLFWIKENIRTDCTCTKI